MIRHFASLALALALSIPTASAADMKICVVSAEEALNATTEGKNAQSKLEKEHANRQAEIEGMQKTLEQEFKDYESRKLILSESARAEVEQGLMAKQQQFQQLVMQSEQGMQQLYMQLLSEMEGKLLAVAQTLGETAGCTLLLQREAVIFSGDSVVDLTAQLAEAYNKQG